MPKLTALQPIDHDGERYEEGDSLEVSNEKQAKALIDVGAAELATPVPRKRTGKTGGDGGTPPAGGEGGQGEGGQGEGGQE